MHSGYNSGARGGTLVAARAKDRTSHNNAKETETMETTQRPSPVILLAVLAFVLGAMRAMLSLSILTGASFLATRGDDTGGLMLYGLVLLALSLADLTLGYGAWNLKSWAWPLGVGLQIAALALAVALLAIGSDIARQLLTIAPAVTMLVILVTPGVRQAFGRR
jgi:hypothetical protein